MPMFLFFSIFFFVIVYKNTSQSPINSSQGRSISSLVEKRLVQFEIEDAVDKSRFEKFIEKESLTPFEVDGELIAVADDFDLDPKKHHIKYFIKDKRSFEHEVKILNDDFIHQVGAKIKFRGFLHENKGKGFIISEGQTQISRLRPPSSVKIEKMLVLPFKFKNSQTTYITHPQLKEWFFNGAFQRFYRDISDNKILHHGEVYPWFYLDRNGEDDGNTTVPCRISNNEVMQALQTYQIDITKYDQITLLSNCTEYGTIGGRASIAKTDFLNIGFKINYIWMAGFPSKMTIPSQPHSYVLGWNGLSSILIHERGHNFGLYHSDGLDCEDRPYLQNCIQYEYGNMFDRMGGARGSFLFNAHQQKLAGFKMDTEFLHIKEPGRYIIDKLTSKKLNRKIGAYLYHPLNTTQKAFMLEFRTPDGMDNNLNNPKFSEVKNGAIIYTTLTPSDPDKTPGFSNFFKIIDVKPTGLEFCADTDAESLQGEFYDPKSGIRINVFPPVNDQIQFIVDYDQESSFCGKSELKDWVSSPFVKLYYDLELNKPSSSPKSGTGSVDSTSGQITEVDHPKFSKEIKRKHIILIPGDFFHFKFKTLIGEHLVCDRHSLEVKILNPTALQPFFVLSSTNVNSFKKTTSNYDSSFEFPIFKVPPSQLDKDFKIELESKDKVTGITRKEEVYLHIRGKRDAILK